VVRARRIMWFNSGGAAPCGTECTCDSWGNPPLALPLTFGSRHAMIRPSAFAQLQMRAGPGRGSRARYCRDPATHPCPQALYVLAVCGHGIAVAGRRAARAAAIGPGYTALPVGRLCRPLVPGAADLLLVGRYTLAPAAPASAQKGSIQ
jgi:hypothetical protein